MKRILASTPKEDNFRMPAEWEEHKAMWVLWPQRRDNWREKAIPAQSAFVNVIKAIAKHTPVILGVNHNQYMNAFDKIKNIKNVKLVELSSDDSWARDTGFTIVVNDETNEIRAIDWIFNAWGGKYDGLYSSWEKDQKVAHKMSEFHQIKRYKLTDFVLEGGSIHVDGKGTCIVTKACLLSRGRNPDLTQQQIECKLKEYLNVEKVIWLPHGIYNDETNEHVDNIAHFGPNNKVLLAWTDNKNDPQYDFSKQSYDVLRKETSASGKPFEIIKVHIPDTITITKEEAEGVIPIDGTYPRNKGDRLPASYVNFLITNGQIILPVFNDKKWDKNAINIIQNVFPSHKIKPIYAREILLGGGNIHCITQQVCKK